MESESSMAAVGTKTSVYSTAEFMLNRIHTGCFYWLTDPLFCITLNLLALIINLKQFLNELFFISNIH